MGAMAGPNTLIFADLPTDDPEAAAHFYGKVLGWTDEARLPGLFHRLTPGGKLRGPDGEETSAANLAVGVYHAGNARPHPDPKGPEPRGLAKGGRRPRLWILLGEGQSAAVILDKAEKLGGKVLWRNHFWKAYNGFACCFADPWGNEIVLWSRGGQNPVIPAGYTTE